MRFTQRPLFALAVSGWLVAAPPASFTVGALVCRHQAMHRGMQHGAPTDAPCWCADMTGGALGVSDAPPLLPAESVPLPGEPVATPAPQLPGDGTASPSPSYAPSPPPPNGRPA